MADNESISNGPGKSQWDNLEKEDLIKQIKKQLILLKKVKVKCDDLAKTNENLESNFRTKSDECSKLMTQIGTLESGNNTLNASVLKVESENWNHLKKIQMLEEQLECVHLKEQTANATFICLQEDIKNLQSKNQELLKEIGILNTAKDEALNLIKSRESELKANYEKDLEELNSKLVTFGKSQQELETTSQQLKNENECLNKSLSELQSVNDQFSSRIQTLEAELKSSKDETQGLNVELKKTLSECQILSTTTSVTEEEFYRYKTKLENISPTVDLIIEAFNISTDVEDVESKLKAILTASSNLNSTRADDSEAFERFNKKIDEFTSLNSTITDKIEDSFEFLKTLEVKVKALEASPNISSTESPDMITFSQAMNLVENQTISTQVDYLEFVHSLNNSTQTLNLSTMNGCSQTSEICESPDVIHKQNEAVTVAECGTQTEIEETSNKVEEDFKISKKMVEDLEERLVKADEMVGKYRNVTVKTKKEVAELKKQLSDMSSELQVSVSERNSIQSRMESISSQLVAVTKDKLAAENTSKSLQTQLNAEKEKHKNTSSRLEHALKEANKSNLISLEIADYEKLVGDLNKQLESKDAERNKLQSEYDAQKQAMKAFETEIEQLEVQNRQSEERAEQLKVYNSKLKVEIAALRESERNWKSKEEMFNVQQETNSQEIENYKLQMAVLANDVGNLKEANRVLQDANQKVLRSSENRIATLVKDLQTVKEEYSYCQTEYENYKVRVHSVLKQQKKSPVINSKETSKNEDTLEENGRLGKMADMLQTRVQELTAQLNSTNSELESLQEEHQNVLQRHNKLLSTMSEQEASWKQRFEMLQKEMQSKEQELVHIRQMEKQQQLTLNISVKQQIEALEKKNTEKLAEMQAKLDLAQDEISRLQRDAIDSRNSMNSAVREEEMLDLTSTERQEGEGSESTDTVFGTPHRLVSNNGTHTNSTFIPLEQLLNQDEKASIQSANSLEIEKLENQLSVGMKKIEHLTEILNESEAANARMTEQTRVLKEEIRRLERNQEREQHLANLEYTKNVIVKFLSLPKGDERERLVPVLTTLLRLSPEEERQVHSVALGAVDVNNPLSVPGWSSYLPRWPGGF